VNREFWAAPSYHQAGSSSRRGPASNEVSISTGISHKRRQGGGSSRVVSRGVFKRFVGQFELWPFPVASILVGFIEF